MAIQIYCAKCRNSCSLDKECPNCGAALGGNADKKKCPKCGKAPERKKCPSCGVVFARDKKYRVSVSVKGKRVNRIVDNLTIAREIEPVLKAELLRDEFDIADHRVKEVVTLADVWKKYLPWAKANKAKSWMTDDFFYRKHLEPRFAKKALEEIAPLDIERMKAEMKKMKTPQGQLGYSDATIRHQLVLLGHLFKKAREWEMFDGKSPTEFVKKPKLDNEITEFLTDDEMERLSETLDSWPCKRSADFVRIGLFTGIRKGEILKLRWEDVDLDRKTLTLKDPKGGLTTSIPLSDEAVAVFLNIEGSSETERHSEYVLPGIDDGMKKTFRHPWYNIRKAAGLPAQYRLHGLRHNLASHLVSSGVDLYTVGKLLTHKDVRTTERYAHLSDEALRTAAQKSGALLAPKAKARPALRIVE